MWVYLVSLDSTHVHGLVDLSAVDDLPSDLDVVGIEVGLDLVLVDGVDDWLSVGGVQGKYRCHSLESMTIRTRCHRL